MGEIIGKKGVVDYIMELHEKYHCISSTVEDVAMNRSIFDSLTSGGIYGILDHHTKPGHGIDDCHSIHRIEKDFVIKEVVASGFVLEDELNILENPDDDLTLMVFEKEIRNRTSRFVLKFRKP